MQDADQLLLLAKDLKMTAKDAIELYKLFDQHGIKVWIDALLGHQIRKHGDLDVAIYTIPVSRPSASF